MKEIWKLIELLNEYEKRESWISNARTTNFAFLYYLNNPASISELTLISKKYWFIKWLVENEKIDFSNIDFYFLQREQYTKTESLLMLLSISDTPIEDLITFILFTKD